MPVFRSAPPAKVVVGTGHDGCRSTVTSVHHGFAFSVLFTGIIFGIEWTGLDPAAFSNGGSLRFTAA